MKKTFRFIIIVALILVAAIFAAFKLSVNKKEVEARVYKPDVNIKVTIQAEKVKQSPFKESTPFLGSFAPNREVAIASETTGKVITVGVKEGSHVGAGSLIAQLDNGVLKAALASAQATLANAKSTLNRYEQAQAGVTKLQIDNAKTTILTSQAQIEQLSRQISQYTIHAPFSGIITTRNFDLGAIVSPGVNMATLIDISTLKLEVSVPEKYVVQFKNGASMPVKTAVYPDAVFNGKVNFIASKADASHNYTVKILVTNKDKTPLKGGMYGTLTTDNFAAGSSISIPRSALVGSTENPQVYVIENGVAKLRTIQLGAGNESAIQVVSGLEANETVATGGLVNLTDGAKVEIK